MSVLFIALLHAVPVFFIAAWTGRKVALVLAAVVSGCIGVATGNPSYVAADLFGVAVAYALYINTDAGIIASSFFAGVKSAINERRGIKPSAAQTPAVAAKIAALRAMQPAPGKIEACKDYAAYKDYAYHSSLKIRVQFVQSRTPVSEVFSKEDMWAMGYIFGFADGWMQHFGISNTDQEGMFFLVCFYCDLHGAPENALNKALNSQNSSIFMRGMLVGGSDALSFKQDDTEPLALTKHLSSTVNQCATCGKKRRVPNGKVIDINCQSCRANARQPKPKNLGKSR